MPEAVKVNTQILELDPDNLPALTRRGLCYLNLGKYLTAKEDLSRALQRYPVGASPSPDGKALGSLMRLFG